MSSAPSTNGPIPIPAGTLTAEEGAILAKSMKTSMRGYMYGAIAFIFLGLIAIGLLLFGAGPGALAFLIIALLMGPSLLFVWRKSKRRVQLIETGILELQKISGILTIENYAPRNGTLLVYRLDNFDLPEVVAPMDIFIEGQSYTAEFIPAISKNRCLYDDNGQGFNFITRIKLQPK